METPLLRSARCGWAAGTMLGACAPRSKRGHGASAGSTACVLDARGPNGCGLVYGVGKNPDPVAPLALRFVQGLVRRAQQGLRVRRVVGEERDPEGRGDLQQLVAIFPYGRADCLGLAMRALGGGGGQHQRELLAPVAAGDVAAADMALEQRGDLHEDKVAGGVPGSVVDLLEAVEVDHDQRDPTAFAL